MSDVYGVEKIIFQFVFSHCNVIRNELVDKFAEEAMNLSIDERHRKQNMASISFQATRCTFRRCAIDQWKAKGSTETNDRVTLLDANPTDLKKLTVFNRSDESLLHRLRTGHIAKVGKLRGLLMKEEVDFLQCQWCKCDYSEESVGHLFNDCKHIGVCTLRKKHNIEDI